MACSDLSSGRAWQCNEQIGGIKAVYFANYPGITGVVTDGAIANTGAISLYKYALEEYTGNLSEAITVGEGTGTLFYEQTLTLQLTKLQASDIDEMKLLATSRPQILVQDNNDNYLLLGYSKGVRLTAGTKQTGTAGNELSGYNLTFVGREKDSAPFLTSISQATIVTS